MFLLQHMHKYIVMCYFVKEGFFYHHVLFCKRRILRRKVFVPHLGKCIYYWYIQLPTYQDVVVPACLPACTSEANSACARGSERRSCMTAVPSGYTSHQGNPVSRPELQPFRSFISSRHYVTSATVRLIYVTTCHSSS